jgi:hypothetical protein
MAYTIGAGLQVSLTGADGTWQRLTDHNREPIQVSVELIESQSRMANGTMRKYVVAKKRKISVSWKYVPSQTSESADGFHAAAWIESFYQSNAGIPIYIKVVASELATDAAAGSLPSGTFTTAQTASNYASTETGAKRYSVFMTDFSKTIINRTKLSDYVDMSIEFTEI